MRTNRATVCALVAAVAAWTPCQAAAPKVGQPAPDFTVSTYGGHEVKLSDLKGDVVVLNFWATWCGPCKRELPLLEAAFRGWAKYGFQVLAVTSEDSLSERDLKPLSSKMTIPFVRRMRGPYRELGGYPTNYVIDRTGKLVYAKADAFDGDALDKVILPLLQQPIPDAAPVAAPNPPPTQVTNAAPTPTP